MMMSRPGATRPGAMPSTSTSNGLGLGALGDGPAGALHTDGDVVERQNRSAGRRGVGERRRGPEQDRGGCENDNAP